MEHPYIREAAESLLSSVSPHNRTLMNSHSVNLVSEDLAAGHRPGGNMSTVRRFFCLFVTFDLMFTSLMWLICVMIRGVSLRVIFDSEVIHYNVNHSLFDIVMVAVSRFIVLLLFYGLLYINNWSVIALSTGGTCAFLIAKVFVFDWPNASQPVYEVFLILTSFTLAWGETWFLDFRVLPQELQAKQLLESIVHHGASERTPLLSPGQAPAHRSNYAESTVKWFSPVETPESSPKPRRPGEQVILTQEQIDEYKAQAQESMANAWHIVNLPNWTVEKRGSHKGDVVESKRTDHFGKVYRFTGIVECPPKFLYDEFRDNVTRLPEWNPTILKSELIKEIGPGIDLTYQVTAGGGRGIIAPRDFVNLRRTARLARDGRALDDAGGPGDTSDTHSYISSAVSVAVPGFPPRRELVRLPSNKLLAINTDYGDTRDTHSYISSAVSVAVPGFPPRRELVRGQNKVGCWYLRPRSVQTAGGRIETHTTFQWLMCCDLKGKIPQFILDAAFATVMLDYSTHVRKFVADAKASGRF